MKYTFIVIFTLFVAACSKPQKTPYLTLKPDNQINSVVELYEFSNVMQVFDKAKPEADNKEFVFRKDSVPNGIYELRIGGQKVTTLIISNSFPTSVSGEFMGVASQLTIAGNDETKALWKCERLAKQAEKQIAEVVASLPDSVAEGDFYAVRDSVYGTIQSILEDKAKEIKRINNTHRTSLLPLLTMQLKVGNHYVFNPEDNAELYYEVSNQMQSLYSDYPPVNQFASQVDSLMNRSLFNAITKEGRTLPSIAIPDAWQKEVIIDSLGNKPTLFVLWKSTDEASRSITRQLMRWSWAYRSQGLQLCMIALDEDRQSWLDAIKEDRLAVQHLSDLKGDKSEVLSKLGLTSVPCLLLVDENKIIVKRTRELEELSASLRQLMKK